MKQKNGIDCVCPCFNQLIWRPVAKPSWKQFSCLIGSLDRVLGPVIKKSRVRVNSFFSSSSFKVHNMQTLPRSSPLSHFLHSSKHALFIYLFILKIIAVRGCLLWSTSPRRWWNFPEPWNGLLQALWRQQSRTVVSKVSVKGLNRAFIATLLNDMRPLKS